MKTFPLIVSLFLFYSLGSVAEEIQAHKPIPSVNTESPNRLILSNPSAFKPLPSIDKPLLSMVSSTKWDSNIIPVCWENAKYIYQDGMHWTRDAVSKTWQKNSRLKFTGWGQCYSSDKGIRIIINDEVPRTKDLGKKIDGVKNGMVLNFTFNTWSQECKIRREFCIRAIAVHEFGHAIGFTHEQNRPDAPSICKKEVQGTNPDTALTMYDNESSMNYCNKHWNNDGKLSFWDIDGLSKTYGYSVSSILNDASKDH